MCAATGSERRPRNRPAPIRAGHHRILQQRAGTQAKRRDSALVIWLAQRIAERPPRASTRQATFSSVSSSTGLPAHPHSTVRSLSSTCRLTPVVDAVDVAVDAGQDVSALAVGVVDQHVEHRHPAQPDVVGVDQRDLVARIVVGLQDRQIAGRQRVRGQQVDQVRSGLRALSRARRRVGRPTAAACPDRRARRE